MPPQPTESWTHLFAACADDEPRTHVPLRVVVRAGQPFMLLPAEPALAARALDLYPAQTAKARLARSLLALGLRCNIPCGLKSAMLTVSPADPLICFLAASTDRPPRGLPRFAILAGNPRAKGRRFVILAFDNYGRQDLVVKAGVGKAARQLVAREIQVLQSAPAQADGLPRLRGTLTSPLVEAFALDHLPGRSPGLKDTGALGALLSRWIAADRLVSVDELGVWQQLAATAATTPLPKPVTGLRQARFHPVLMHGDCAPWNVKVSGGRWILLDWERGELAGMPGWDWLHFEIQTNLLVRQASVPELLRRIEQLLARDDFSCYLQQTGLAGYERALTLAYLCYSNRITHQADGQERLARLERAVMQRWFSGAG